MLFTNESCFSRNIILNEQNARIYIHRNLHAIVETVGNENVYSSSEQITSAKQLRNPIQCGFYHTKSIRNLEEKLGRNVEIRVWGGLNRKKEERKKGRKNKYRIYNRGYGLFMRNDRCYFTCI